MKVDELKKIAKENDYKLENVKDYEEIILERKVSFDGFISNVITIRSMENLIFIKNKYCDEKDLNMIKASVKFAEDPLEERKEEKKFYLRHSWMGYTDHNYLTLCKKTHKYYLSYKTENEEYTTKFTRKEIDQIKERFNVNLSDFYEDKVKE